MSALLFASILTATTYQALNAYDKALVDRFRHPEAPGFERHLAYPTQLRLATHHEPGNRFGSRLSAEQSETLTWTRVSTGEVALSTPKKVREAYLQNFSGYFDSRRHSSAPWWNIGEGISNKYGKRLISYPHSASSSFCIYLKHGGTRKAIVTRIELLVRSDGLTEQWLNAGVSP